MSIKHTLTKTEVDSKKLFLLDGFGAILSAFLLGIVLVKYEIIFGIPSSVLYFLAAVPVFYAIYDLYCYRRKHDNSGPYLIGIALLNLFYCFLSIGLAIYHAETITYLGWIYITIEIIILLILAIIEFRVGKKLTKL